MSDSRQTFVVDKSVAGHWRVILDNPPINVIDDGMYDAFYDLVGEIEADAGLKVVSFESANPDYFIAHLRHVRAAQPLWRAALDRCGDKASEQRRAEHRSHTRKSSRRRQRVRLGVPYSLCEPGEGDFRAAGGWNRLDTRGRSASALAAPRWPVSRSRNRYGRERLRRRQRRALRLDKSRRARRRTRRFCRQFCRQRTVVRSAGAAYREVNHQSHRLARPGCAAIDPGIFFQSFTWEGARERMLKLRERGIGQAGDFELDLGRHIGSL
jgi:hypothetical protein